MAIQTEAQRQYYLGMAGIRCWYARSPQPGAAASPALDFTDVGEEPTLAMPAPVAPTPRPSKQAGRKAGLADLRGLMGETPRPAEAAGQQAPAPVRSKPETPPRAPAGKAVATEATSVEIPAAPEAPVREDTRPVSAHWGLWPAGPWLLVSALSAEASEQLQQKLAHNILQALGAEAEAGVSLHWPVFNNPQITGNDRAGLMTLVQDLRREWPERQVIALGLCQGSDWPDRSDWLAAALGEPVVDFEFSLPALASDPGRKRALWSRLRPLVTRVD